MWGRRPRPRPAPWPGPVSRRTRRPPRSRGTAPQSRCQSDHTTGVSTFSGLRTADANLVGQQAERVRDTKVDAEAIHQQNGLNPSVCVRKAAGAFVGQLGKLRPIINRPDAALAPDGGGSQPPRRLPACPTSRQRFHFYVVHPGEPACQANTIQTALGAPSSLKEMWKPPGSGSAPQRVYLPRVPNSVEAAVTAAPSSTAVIARMRILSLSGKVSVLAPDGTSKA